jgi:hypothetical protein
MRKKMQRLALLGVIMGGVLMMGLVAPVSAAGTTQIAGTSAFEDGVCSTPPAGFDDYPGLALHGDLEGCLYTDVVTSYSTPSGVYHETGRETVVASLNGGPVGTFTTTYKFEAKFDPDSGAELKGRCQHPITAGSGTGAFAGTTGRLDFKDIIGDPVTYEYRGHITLS